MSTYCSMSSVDTEDDLNDTVIEWMTQRHGLRWMADGYSNITPEWTIEFSNEAVEQICRDYMVRMLADEAALTNLGVKFLGEGAFNRVYVVDAVATRKTTSTEQVKTGIVEEQSFYKLVFRATLPVDSGFKSLSEVSTIKFLRDHTEVPVVSVLDCVHHQNNALGFEWMIQSFSPGRRLEECWDDLSVAGRERMVVQLAEIQYRLFTKAKFSKIGSIFAKGYKTQDMKAVSEMTVSVIPDEYEIGELVTNQVIEKINSIDMPSRGPFRNTAEWLIVELKTRIAQCSLEKSSRFPRNYEDLARRLLAMVAKLFPEADAIGDTVLFHDDLHRENIFCGSDGSIASIIDWEATSCLPIWALYTFPKLFADLPAFDWDGDNPWIFSACPPKREDFPDEEKYEYKLQYWENNREDYQLWELRELYVRTMRRIWPDWAVQCQKPENWALQDLHMAVISCDNPWCYQSTHAWLDELEKLERWEYYRRLSMF